MLPFPSTEMSSGAWGTLRPDGGLYSGCICRGATIQNADLLSILLAGLRHQRGGGVSSVGKCCEYVVVKVRCSPALWGLFASVFCLSEKGICKSCQSCKKKLKSGCEWNRAMSCLAT